MTFQMAKIKNGTVTLPKEFRKRWVGANVVITSNRDSFVVKRLMQPSLSHMKVALKAVGKRISQKDIDNAVVAVRRERGH